MIQTQIQTADYWHSFKLTDSDIEQIYNSFLEKERPQTTTELVRTVVESRVREQATELRRLLADRTVYQPQKSFAVGEELVFPALKLAQGKVTGIRPGFNPEYGAFNVIAVDIKGKAREFASDLKAQHALNESDGAALAEALLDDSDEIVARYGPAVAGKIAESLSTRDDFVRMGMQWFVKSLMAEVNIGHLHLAEAILEVEGGGPLSTEAIMEQLDLDPSVDASVQAFSLNHALLNDERFDEVSPTESVAWFLRRLEPEAIQKTPERLEYQPVAYDRALLTPQLIQLEQELDDEWSDLPTAATAAPTVFTLSYAHRWAGTIPLNSRTRPLFPPGRSPRQRFLLIDDTTDQEIVVWATQEGRYVAGLADWYKENSIPIGGFLHLQPGPEPGVVTLGYDRRRSQREWVRLATVKDNRLTFELSRRSIPCGYDDLLIVGTDVIAAIDAHWRRATAARRSLASLLAEIFPSLAGLSPQNTVHAKTLYSAVNMLRRVPPGPVFAELVRQPAFKTVGDLYWVFESELWQERN